MAKNCEIVYLDENGNRAAAYYNNVESKGHEEALKIYTVYMSNKRAYKKVGNFEKLKSDSDKLNKEKSKYKGVTNIFEEVQEATDVLNSNNGKSEDDIAGEYVIKSRARQIMLDNPKEYEISNELRNNLTLNLEKLNISQIAIEKAKLEFASDPIKFENFKNVIKDNWKFHREAGSSIDKKLTDFYEEWNKEAAVSDEEPDINYILKERIFAGDTSFEEKDVYKTIIEIHTEVTKLIKKKGIKNYEIIPQLKISNDELEQQGILDLVIHDKDTNKLIVIDFKFKEEGKEYLFSTTSFGRLAGVFNTLNNNKRSQAEIQLTGYTLLLEKEGFDPKNIETYILPITGKPILEGSTQKRIGYKDLKANTPISTIYQRSMIAAYYASKGKNINKKITIEKDKHNFVSDIVDDLTDKKYKETALNPERQAEKLLNGTLKKHPITGKDCYYDIINREYVNFFSENFNDRKAQLIKYYETLAKDKDKLLDDIIIYYNNLKNNPSAEPPRHLSDAMVNQVNKIINSLNSDDYTLQQLKNINGFENENPNILVAKHNKTGNAKIFYIQREFDRDIKILDKSKNATTIFSKYVNDMRLLQEYGFKGFSSKLSNIKLFEAGLLSLKLKDNNYINAVESIATVIVNGNLQTDDAGIYVAYMSDILPQLQILPKIMGNKLSTDLKKLLENKDLLSTSSHKIDYLSELIDLVSTSNEFKPLRLKNFDKKIKDSYDTYVSLRDNKTEMLKILYEGLNIMYDSLKRNTPTDNPVFLAKNKAWSLLAQSTLQIMNISFDSNALNRERKKGLDADILKLYGNMDSPVIQEIYSIDQATQIETKRKYNEFKKEHSELIQKLKEDFYKASKKLHTDYSLNEIFKPLFKENPSQPVKDINKAYILKDENDPSLTKPQQDYIKFFNKNIKKGFSYILSSEEVGNLDKNWQPGMVPLKVASFTTRITEEENFKNKLKLSLQNLQYQGVKQTKNNVDSLFYKITNQYKSQLKEDSGVQGSRKRREFLNIDDTGQVIQNSESLLLENNLEYILDDFMSDAITQLSYEPAFAVFNAIQVKLILEENESGKFTKDLREQVDNYIKLMIFNTYNESKVGKFFDSAKNLANFGLMGGIGGSPKQILQESGQGFIAKQSMLLNNLVASAFKDDEAFLKNPYKSSLEANKFSFASEKISKENAEIAMFITEDFSFFSGDLNSMKSEDFKETRNGSIFRSKWLMFLNAKPYRHFFSHAFFTKLIDDGVMSAYVVKNGKVEYDPVFDKRFNKIFDSNGKLKNTTTTDEEKQQMALYLSLLKDLKNEENGVKSDGKINRPYSSLELVAFKDYFMKSFGSMDKNSKVEAHQNALWRSVMSYKNFFLAKKDNYWTESDYKLSKGKRVLIKNEETGEYFGEFRPQLDEGIIQTIHYICIHAQECFNSGNFSSPKLAAVQKENLRRLINDIVLAFSLWLLLMSLKDMFKSKEGKYFYQIADNAIKDLNMINTTDSVVNGNPFVIYSYFKKVASSTTAAISYGCDGDYDNAINQASRVSGFFKFMSNL